MIKRFGIQCLYFVALLALLEAVVRVTGAAERCSDRVSKSAWLVCYPILGYKLNPQQKPNGQPLNRAGFRTHEFTPKAPGTYRILALGDSCTLGRLSWGYVGEPYPQRLERMAAERAGEGRIEVLNAGQGGYSSYHGVMLLRSKLRGLEPDLITVRYGWNDLIMSAAESPREPGAVGIAVEDVLLRTALYGFVKRLNRELRALRQTTVEGTLAALERGKERRPINSRSDYEHNLRRIIEIGRARGAEVWLLTAPHNPRPSASARAFFRTLTGIPYDALPKIHDAYNDATRAVGAELGVRVVDMDAVYREHAAAPLFQHDDIPHPTQAGHDLEAEALYARLVARGILPPSRD